MAKRLGIGELRKLVGGLSTPTKMPWYGWSLSASDCKVGSKLAEIPGTPCFSCYAMRGNYAYPVVQNAYKRRMEAWKLPDWVENMSALIGRLAEKESPENRYFRWFDSGDIQSISMLCKIVQIARNVPEVQFWLPTQERQIVADYSAEYGEFPSNLTIRVSAVKIGMKPTQMNGTVSSNINGEGYQCPARSQGNKCGNCRKCWDNNTPLISYHKH